MCTQNVRRKTEKRSPATQFRQAPLPAPRALPVHRTAAPRNGKKRREKTKRKTDPGKTPKHPRVSNRTDRNVDRNGSFTLQRGLETNGTCRKDLERSVEFVRTGVQMSSASLRL